MSLIKTRCRASRRGEVFSPVVVVGVRLPNPYENVHLCLEFAIYQTHVILDYGISMARRSTVALRAASIIARLWYAFPALIGNALPSASALKVAVK